MRKSIFICLIILVLCVSCAKNSSPVKVAVPTELEQKFAYSIGGMLYDYYGPYYSIDENNIQFLIRGMYDKATDHFLYDEETKNKIMSEYSDVLLQKMGDENLKKAEDFLKENSSKAGVVTTSSGLQYQVLRKGNGKYPAEDSTVAANYALSDIEGNIIQKVDASNGGPISFVVNQLVPGIKEGLCLMSEGAVYRFWVHPSLGYGENGSQAIGPNQLLVFDFELVSIN